MDDVRATVVSGESGESAVPFLGPSLLDPARFLVEASARLAASLDYEEVLAAAVRAPLPALGDICAIDVVEQGVQRRRVVAHADPAREPLLHELIARYPPGSLRASPVAEVIRTGRPELVQVTGQLLEVVAPDAEFSWLVRELGVNAAMLVPVTLRGQLLAVLSVATTADRSYGSSDLTVAAALADRTAIALDHARLYREAQERIRERDDFLAIVSHDLKNPLSAIRVRAQTLAIRAGRIGSGEVDQFVQGLTQIDVSTRRMARVLSEMRDAAKLSRNLELDLVKRRIDLVALVERVVEDLQPPDGQPRIELEVDTDELWCVADAFRVERVVDNLLSNAIKYSPGRDLVEAHLSSESGPPAQAVLVVRDYGLGIPSEDLPFVFEPYQRASNVRRMQGTGIGLHGARRIVEQHGGTIQVESQEGVGTTVTVRIPLQPAAELPAATSA